MRYWLAIVLLLGGCMEQGHPVTTVEQVQKAVINGQLETGYSAVGALALETNIGYFGGFCSSTLINTNWVLTAAHCIDGAEEQANEIGFNLSPRNVNFVVASNSNPTFNYGRPPNALLYQAEAIYVHPNYDPSAQIQNDDIALIRLRTSVPNVTPIPIFRGDLTQNVGDTLTYVGFGTSNPNSTALNSSGIKRRTALPIHVVGAASYVSIHNNTGICFGDSGGPGILTQGSTQYVASVNSTVSGESPTCLLASNQMRVDAYQSWIDYVMGNDPNCASNQNLCQCDAACTNDGYCDHTQCGELGLFSACSMYLELYEWLVCFVLLCAFNQRCEAWLRRACRLCVATLCKWGTPFAYKTIVPTKLNSATGTMPFHLESEHAETSMPA